MVTKTIEMSSSVQHYVPFWDQFYLEAVIDPSREYIFPLVAGGYYGPTDLISTCVRLGLINHSDCQHPPQLQLVGEYSFFLSDRLLPTGL